MWSLVKAVYNNTILTSNTEIFLSAVLIVQAVLLKLLQSLYGV